MDGVGPEFEATDSMVLSSRHESAGFSRRYNSVVTSKCRSKMLYDYK
jgi:hypothetical protein